MIVFTTIIEESASYNTGSNRSSNYDTSVAQNLLQILSPNLSDVILLALNDTAEKSFQQTNGMTIQKVLETVNSSIGQLTNITRTLSNLIENTNSTGGKINDVLLVMQELLDLQNSSSLFKSIRQVSCKDIKAALPNSPSGYYHVNSRNIYCQMDELCGSERGWTRLAYLDMFDAQQKCPSGFRTYQTGGVRACGRLGGGADCTASIFYPSNGIYYSQVCGRVILVISTAIQMLITLMLIMLTSHILMVLVSHKDHLVNTSGLSWLDLLKLLKILITVRVHLTVQEVSSHLLVITIIVSLETQTMLLQLSSIQQIHFGMVTAVFLLKQNAVLLPIFHGFTEILGVLAVVNTLN